MKLFSQNLNVLRKTWNLSQAEVAEKFGVAGPSYSRWENGTEPTYETLLAIAQFFKISIDRLLSEELTPQTVPPRWGGKDYARQPDGAGDVARDASGEDGGEFERLMERVHEEMKTLREEVGALKEEVDAIKKTQT